MNERSETNAPPIEPKYRLRLTRNSAGTHWEFTVRSENMDELISEAKQLRVRIESELAQKEGILK